MSNDDSTSAGDTSNEYLEKITPKDLVMFSTATRKQIAKNDFNYLGVDYDLEFDKEEAPIKKRVWGLPVIDFTDPLPMGVLGGLSTGIWFNAYKKRPFFASIFDLSILY